MVRLPTLAANYMFDFTNTQKGKGGQLKWGADLKRGSAQKRLFFVFKGSTCLLLHKKFKIKKNLTSVALLHFRKID